MKFIADLGGCNEIAYHYELICKDWEEGKNLYLENSSDNMEKKELNFYLNGWMKSKKNNSE